MQKGLPLHFWEKCFFLTSSTVWLCSRCCLFCRCKCPSHVQYDVAVFQWRWLCGSCSEVHCQKGGYAVLSHRQKKCPKRVCGGWPARGWVAGVIQCSCRYSAHIYKHAGLKRVLNTNLRFLHESSRCFVEPLGQTHFPYTSKLRSTGTANWCPWIVCDASYWLVWTSSQCCCHIIVWTQLTMALSSMPFLSCPIASTIQCQVWMWKYIYQHMGGTQLILGPYQSKIHKLTVLKWQDAHHQKAVQLT